MTLVKDLRNGVANVALAKYLGVFVQIAVMAVMARYLSPEEFGLAAISLILIVFISVLAVGGLSSGIIQNKELSLLDIDNVFSFSLYLATLLAVSSLGLSYLVSVLYADEAYWSFAPYVAIIVFFTVGQNVPEGVLKREKNFKILARIEIFSNVIAGVIAIICVVNGGGVLVLFFQALVRVVLAFIAKIYFTNLTISIIPSVVSVRKILKYSIYDQGVIIQNYMSRSVDSLLIGKVLGAVELGFYDRAYRLLLFPLKNLSVIINPVLHPVLASRKLSKVEVSDIYYKLIKLLSIIGLPLSILIYFSSDSIINVLYGNGWNRSIPILQILALSIFPQLVLGVLKSFFLSSGKAKEMFRVNLISNAVIVICICIGVFTRDLFLLSILISFGYWLRCFIESAFLSRIYLKGSLSRHFLSIKTGILIALLLIPILYFASQLNYPYPVVKLIFNCTISLICGVLCLYLTNEHLVFMNMIKRKV